MNLNIFLRGQQAEDVGQDGENWRSCHHIQRCCIVVDPLPRSWTFAEEWTHPVRWSCLCLSWKNTTFSEGYGQFGHQRQNWHFGCQWSILEESKDHMREREVMWRVMTYMIHIWPVWPFRPATVSAKAGKSTLLKVMQKKLFPTAGQIEVNRNARIGSKSWSVFHAQFL